MRIREKNRIANVATRGMVFAVVLVSTWGVCERAHANAPLPDGRAWEMVSPLEKNGGEINGIDGTVPDEGLPEGGIVQAAEDGNSITYLSLLAFRDSMGKEPEGAPIASQYLSLRHPTGWLTEDITTAVNSGSYPPAGSGAPYEAFSSDLSRALMLDGNPAPVENPPLGGAPPRYVNYYLRDNIGKTFEPLVTSSPAEVPNEFGIELLGTTPDLGHVVVGSRAALPPVITPQSEGNLYEWADGGFQPINVLPAGIQSGQIDATAPGGARLGMGFNENRTISSDGSRVFWDQPGSLSLFVRENIATSQAMTVQVDASHEGTDPGGFGEFKTASKDGSKVFFTDRERLTPDSTAGGFKTRQDLYLFDVDTNQLTDLTVDSLDPGGAAVLGVLEASDDGSYVYFVAKGSLPGTDAVSGNNNLYMWHAGSIKFIRALSSDDNGNSGFHEPVVAHDWDTSTGDRTARVTPDGQHLLFMSDARLTSYDNRDINTGEPDQEIYLYDAVTANLTCISCRPNGARPTGSSGFPGGTPLRTGDELGTYQPRILSIDGNRVFFDSKDALTSQDSNGVQDVYEWERNGAGSCRREDGCVFLLSGATSISDSSLVDASANGSDVFFVTRAELVGSDTDQLRDLYDARIGGGFPVSGPHALPCEAEGCLPSPSLQLAPSNLASSTFNGKGNIARPTGVPGRPAKRKKRSSRKRHKKAPRRSSRGRKANAHSLGNMLRR